MAGARTNIAAGMVMCIATLAACSGTPGTAPRDGSAAESPADDQPTDDGATDDGSTDAPVDAPADDPPDGAGSDEDASAAPGSDQDLPAPDADEVLLDALARFDELRRADTAELRGYCVQLSDWAALRAAAPVVDQVEDAGFAVRNEVELTMFGCAAARREPQLFGVQVTVERAPLDVPAGLEPATTPAGREVLVGQVELGDLSLFSRAPVSAAVLVGQDMVLHVTALPDLLTPEQLPPLVDAALQDLAATG